MVDYGSGTISSLDQAFTAIGALIFLLGPSRDPSGADALVLARVGHFGAAA
jgi:imidazoleglycerol phosphate synthase glutamine amidotransferase subunit HisH